MSVFVRELPASLAWLVIIAGLFMTGGTNPPRWQGIAVCALGLLALTTATIITGRLRIRTRYGGPTELSREETPFSYWLAVCFLMFLTGCVIVSLFTIPRKFVRLLDRRYRQVEAGMHRNQVELLMNFQAQWTTQHLAAFWDDAPLDPARTNEVRSALRYTVPSIRPVTYEITFDDRGKVVGRHRYD